jgi:histidine ammonia-lyase
MSGSVQNIRLVPGEVDLATLRAIYQGGVALTLADEARAAIDRASATVDAIVASGNVVYGINTGFGKLAQTQIPAGRLDHQPGTRPFRCAHRPDRSAAGVV